MRIYAINWQNVNMTHHASVHCGASDLQTNLLDYIILDDFSDLLDIIPLIFWLGRKCFQMFAGRVSDLLGLIVMVS